MATLMEKNNMWIIQLCIIILTTSIFGALAKQVGQSRVVGEIAAGLLLGPSILGTLGGSYYGAVFSSDIIPIMSKLADLGLVLLMFQLGLHLDLKVLREKGRMRVPVAVALMGILIPFAIGCAIALLSLSTLGSGIPQVAYVLFCGVTLSISAVPVMSRIVSDLGLTRSSIATIALAAATMTDALGWLMLALISAFAVGVMAWLDVVRNVALLCVFTGVSLLVIRPIWNVLFRSVARHGDVSKLLPAVFCFVLISSLITAEIGFHSAFGALVSALVLRGQPAFTSEWSKRLDGFVELILMPVFFAYAGIHANLGAISSSSFFPWFSLFLFGAVAGKFGGCYLGARMTGVLHRDACMIGALMNTRGLMELIVLTIGLQLHVIPESVYTMLVIIALVTTAMTVPILRFLIQEKRVLGIPAHRDQ